MPDELSLPIVAAIRQRSARASQRPTDRSDAAAGAWQPLGSGADA